MSNKADPFLRSIVDANNFEAWLDTLLVMISYWLAIYVYVSQHLRGRKS